MRSPLPFARLLVLKVVSFSTTGRIKTSVSVLHLYLKIDVRPRRGARRKSRVSRPALSLRRPLHADLVESRSMSKQLRIPADDLNLLKSLQRHGVHLVIIGGHAVRFHGVDREVEDLDVLVDATGRAEDVRTAISETVGDLPPIDVAEYGKPYTEIRVKRNGLNSEILTSAHGLGFAEVYQAAHAVEVDGLTLRVISKERLIRNKRAAQREKDLQDVECLEAIATI
jgi:predicted nucleotidyltransferase